MNPRANMQWVNGLHFNNLRGDIYGGLTAAVVALPLAMSMGVASGVGPIAGIYGAIFVGLFAAIAGGTPSQVSGPTGPMTVVMAPLGARLAHRLSKRQLTTFFGLFLLVVSVRMLLRAFA